MKRLVYFGVAVFSVIQVCSAATCTSGTLATYFALGSGGCTIGSETLSDFQAPPGTTGATPIAYGSISVTPGGGIYSPSLTFSTTQTASTGALLESIVTFEISGPTFTGSSISLAGSSETVDGAVTEIENFCAGGTFGPDGVSGCTGTAGSLLTLDPIQNTDQSGLGPVSFVSVTNDFTLDGGTAGSASGGTFTDSFTTAPEPASLLFAALGVAVLAGASVMKNQRRTK